MLGDLPIGSLVIGAILLLIGIWGLFGAFHIVSESEAHVVERLGKYKRVRYAGFHFKLPFIESVAYKISLRQQELPLKLETKVSDNVFVTVSVVVQYQAIRDKIHYAVYKLDNVQGQITSYVSNIIRSVVPTMDIDQVMTSQNEIGQKVQIELTDVMDEYGFQIIATLVTDVEPDATVKQSMNAIKAAEQQRKATAQVAEAEKILLISKAEADARVMELQGEGVAKNRAAIMAGYAKSVEELREAVPGADPTEVSLMLLTLQGMDTLENMASVPGRTVIFAPNSPAGLMGMQDQLREILMQANIATQQSKNDSPKTEQI